MCRKPMFNHAKTPIVITAIIVFLMFTAAGVNAQENVIQNNFEHTFNLYNVNGKPFINSNIGVSGTPFFLEAWKYGNIELNEKTTFLHVLVRVDLQNHALHFKDAANAELVIEPGIVRQITLFDSSGKVPAVFIFRCGFPAIDNQNETKFYQVLSDGKTMLLKSFRKSIYEEKDAFSGETRKEFRSYEDYYVYTGGSMQKIKKDKTYILGILNNKKDTIEEYAKANNLGYKSIEDIRKIIDYANSLPQ